MVTGCEPGVHLVVPVLTLGFARTASIALLLILALPNEHGPDLPTALVHDGAAAIPRFRRRVLKWDGAKSLKQRRHRFRVSARTRLSRKQQAGLAHPPNPTNLKLVWCQCKLPHIPDWRHERGLCVAPDFVHAETSHGAQASNGAETSHGAAHHRSPSHGATASHGAEERVIALAS